ncbi:MAG: hypothetical protein ACLQK8_18215 [Streptosporangiaceae bacterium]|jgi:hypothetical protein
MAFGTGRAGRLVITGFVAAGLGAGVTGVALAATGSPASTTRAATSSSTSSSTPASASSATSASPSAGSTKAPSSGSGPMKGHCTHMKAGTGASPGASPSGS